MALVLTHKFSRTYLLNHATQGQQTRALIVKLEPTYSHTDQPECKNEGLIYYRVTKVSHVKILGITLPLDKQPPLNITRSMPQQ